MNTLEPIPLAAPDGRLFAFACPRCLHVHASVHSAPTEQGREERAELSRERAETCCLCRKCNGVPDGKYGRLRLICATCEQQEEAARLAFEQTPERIAYRAAQEAAEATFDTSPSPEAARLLGRLMSDISEDHWCAGWMSGCEFALWRAVETGRTEWGLALIAESEIKQLRLLSEQCNGWVVFGDGGREFVSLPEWKRRYDEASQVSAGRDSIPANTKENTVEAQ